jgi:hypothetical protein
MHELRRRARGMAWHLASGTRTPPYRAMPTTACTAERPEGPQLGRSSRPGTGPRYGTLPMCSHRTGTWLPAPPPRTHARSAGLCAVSHAAPPLPTLFLNAGHRWTGTDLSTRAGVPRTDEGEGRRPPAIAKTQGRRLHQRPHLPPSTPLSKRGHTHKEKHKGWRATHHAVERVAACAMLHPHTHASSEREALQREVAWVLVRHGRTDRGQRARRVGKTSQCAVPVDRRHCQTSGIGASPAESCARSTPSVTTGQAPTTHTHTHTLRETDRHTDRQTRTAPHTSVPARRAAAPPGPAAATRRTAGSPQRIQSQSA